LDKYTQQEIKGFSKSSRVAVARDDEHTRSFIEEAKEGKRQGEKLLLGKITKDVAAKIENKTGVNLKGFNLELRGNNIKHIFNRHGNEKAETRRGQRAVTTDDILGVKDIIGNFDNIVPTEDNGLVFIKSANGRLNAVTLYANGNKSLSLKTMWINKGGA